MEITILPKMTLKAMGCNPKVVAASLDPNPAPVALAVIYGVGRSLKMKEEADGRVSTAIIGSFEATNLQTGEHYQAGKLYLPGGIQELVESALTAAKGDDEDSRASVKFALEIRAVKASNPIGYSYQAVSHAAPVVNDPMVEMRNQITARMQEVAESKQKTIEPKVETGDKPKQAAIPAVAGGKK